MLSKKEYMEQLSRELHKPMGKRFPRVKVHSQGPYSIFAMDLVDMSAFAAANSDVRYMIWCALHDHLRRCALQTCVGCSD